MEMMRKYLSEIWYLRLYLLVIAAVIGLSYSVYYFFEPETVATLGDEDQFFEWATAVSLFLATGFCVYLFVKTRNVFYILLSFLYFFGAGEEISWGQRIIGFKTPEVMEEINVQKELSFHNIGIFNTSNSQNQHKKGLARLLEVNFLFRLFMMGYGIALPFLVYHFKPVRKLSEWAKLPVPPISIGIFFLFNYLVFWLLHAHVLSSRHGLKYLSADCEIFECLGAFILLVISVYFFIDRGKIVPGKDIKNYLFGDH